MEKINNILDLYFEGKTSLEEEKILKKYFASDNVLAEHKMYLPLFQTFEKEKYDSYVAKNVGDNKTIEMVKKKSSARNTIHFRRYLVGSVAAVSLILIGLFSYHSNQADYLIIKGKKIHDSVLAQEVASEKLMQVSNLLGKSLSPMQQMNKIEESLQPLEKANKQIADIKEIINNIN